MTTNEDHLLGWTSRQWTSAFVYYNVCHATLHVPNFWAVVLAYKHLISPLPDLSLYVEVQYFWETKRNDLPGEIILVTADIYRSRKPNGIEPIESEAGIRQGVQRETGAGEEPGSAQRRSPRSDGGWSGEERRRQRRGPQAAA